MGERKNDSRRILALDTRKRAISFYIGSVQMEWHTGLQNQDLKY